MEQTSTTHPLAQTLTLSHSLSAYLKAEFGLPGSAEWVAPSELWTAGSPHLAVMVEAQRTRLRTRAASVIGSALLQSYQWQIIANTLVYYLAAWRVPSLGHAQLRVRRNAEYEVEAIAFGGGRFLALPDDPDAGHSDATVVPDAGALRTALREALEAHFAWVIARICAEVGGKPRGLWLNVADSLAGELGFAPIAKTGDLYGENIGLEGLATEATGDFLLVLIDSWRLTDPNEPVPAHVQAFLDTELAQRLPAAAGGTFILPSDGNAVYYLSALSIPVFVDQLATLLA